LVLLVPNYGTTVQQPPWMTIIVLHIARLDIQPRSHEVLKRIYESRAVNDITFLAYLQPLAPELCRPSRSPPNANGWRVLLFWETGHSAGPWGYGETLESSTIVAQFFEIHDPITPPAKRGRSSFLAHGDLSDRNKYSH
jgi:hypothetical protein